MKRIFTMLGLLVLGLGASAQMNQHSNYIGLNVGGGMNTILYSPTDGNWNPKLGFLGELKYAHFFGKHFGLGFGVQYNMSRAGATFDFFVEEATGLTHPKDGLKYDARTSFRDWKDVQTMQFLSVPIELYWRAPMGERWAFIFGVGASLDFNLSGKYKADDGSFDVAGRFYSTGSWWINADGNPPLPDYGFTSDQASNLEEGDIENLKQMGVSIVADLGFNYAMSNHWGLYLGIYGGYGITNLLDREEGYNTKMYTTAQLSDVSSDPKLTGYNGVVNSDQVDALNLLNVGAKIGINFGWSCNHKAKSEPVTPVVVPYEEPVAEVDDEAAKEARCNQQRMNDADMRMAMENVDADIAEAEKAANANGDAKAKAAVAAAKKQAADAKEAHKNGQYCKAYDLFKAAYVSISDTYAANAKSCANTKSGDKEAAQAADDAALYATAARNDGLDASIAASRNAKINADIACAPVEKPKPYENPNFAERLSREALAMAGIAESQPAASDAQSAAEKGRQGSFADSYATSAASFAKSADAFAAKCNKPAAKALAKEANEHAKKSAEAAKQNDAETAYKEAVAARDAANRINAVCAKAEPMKQVEVQEKLDAINATVNFEFANDSDAQFDEKTNDALNTIVKNLQADKNLKVLITGHTDNIGKEAVNMRYGKQRAETLKKLLVKRGAPAAQISTDSKGPKEPVASNDTEEGRYQNRRAVITIK
ncbi:MAG: OmpA family protein [Bacteroidales bacterium]|nr:OmpA family protein [Bacteroidales bacterium]